MTVIKSQIIMLQDVNAIESHCQKAKLLNKQTCEW